MLTIALKEIINTTYIIRAKSSFNLGDQKRAKTSSFEFHQTLCCAIKVNILQETKLNPLSAFLILIPKSMFKSQDRQMLPVLPQIFLYLQVGRNYQILTLQLSKNMKIKVPVPIL